MFSNGCLSRYLSVIEEGKEKEKPKQTTGNPQLFFQIVDQSENQKISGGRCQHGFPNKQKTVIGSSSCFFFVFPQNIVSLKERAVTR